MLGKPKKIYIDLPPSSPARVGLVFSISKPENLSEKCCSDRFPTIVSNLKATHLGLVTMVVFDV
jgi:hypothetical protein